MQSCTREGVGKEKRAVGQSRVLTPLLWTLSYLDFLNCGCFTAFPVPRFIRYTHAQTFCEPSLIFLNCCCFAALPLFIRDTHAPVNPLTSFSTAAVLQPFQFHSSLDARMSKPSVNPLLSFWTAAVLQPFNSSSDTHKWHMLKLQHFNHKFGFSPLSSCLKQPAHQCQALCYSPFFHKLQTFLFSEYFNWATCLSPLAVCPWKS